MSSSLNPKSLLEYLGIRFLEKTNRLSLCCPFHDDRNPSAGFYQDSEKFFCYTCSLSLDMVGFYAKYREISRSRAEVELEKDFGEIPKQEAIDKKEETDRIRNRADKVLKNIKGLRACVEKEEQLEEILWQFERGKIGRPKMLMEYLRWAEEPAGTSLKYMAPTLE